MRVIPDIVQGGRRRRVRAGFAEWKDRNRDTGYVHRIYCHACDHEMRLTGLDSKLQKRMQATYKDVVLGDFAFGHLFVEGQVMVFPIAVGSLRSIHLENLKRWMRFCNIRLGILANFDAIRLDVEFIRT